jgi:SAM-dependent methyltransferase
MPACDSSGLEKCPACGELGGTTLLRSPDRFHGRSDLYELIQCSACSLVRLDNPPEPAEMARHYGESYDRAIAGAGENSPGRWRDRIATLSHYKESGGAILDLGCSTGSFLSDLPGKDWKRYGIEMSAESASRAKELCGAEIFVGNILDAPFEPGSFDAITCFHVFEHLYEPKMVLAKVSEWLKPGGIFYLMVPNIDSAGARIFRSYWYALELPRHLFHYSPQSLRYLATAAGLDEVSLTTHREVFIEYSMHYVVDECLRRAGLSRRCLAETPNPRLPRRVLRKLFRLTLLQVMTMVASLAGDGESIHAVFRK